MARLQQLQYYFPLDAYVTPISIQLSTLFPFDYPILINSFPRHPTIPSKLHLSFQFTVVIIATTITSPISIDTTSLVINHMGDKKRVSNHLSGAILKWERVSEPAVHYVEILNPKPQTLNPAA